MVDTSASFLLQKQRLSQMNTDLASLQQAMLSARGAEKKRLKRQVHEMDAMIQEEFRRFKALQPVQEREVQAFIYEYTAKYIYASP